MDNQESKASFGETSKAFFRRLTSEIPYLSIFGLVFWQLWNNIAFSGSFWLHSEISFYIAQSLITTHLLSCCVTLLLFAIFAKKIQRYVLSLPAVYAGAVIAVVGTLLVYISREDFLASELLFQTGCICTGFGTTILFLKGFSGLTRLHPKRTLTILSLSMVISTMVYFMLCVVPEEIGVVAFIIIPLFSALFYSLPSKEMKASIKTQKSMHLSKRFILLFTFMMLSSAAFEICRSHITINLSPSVMISNTEISNFILVPLLLILAAYTIAKKDQEESYSRIISIVFVALLVIVIVSVMLYDSKIERIGIVVSLTNGIFNLVTWSILCYVTYANKSHDLRVVALGNTGLASGTVLSSVVAMWLYDSTLSDEVVKYIILAMAVAIVILMIFIFTEHQLDALLVPIQEEEKNGAQEGTPGERRWPSLCERFGKENKLSDREITILTDLTSGRSIQEIATEQVISVYTVRSHIRSIHAKLDVHSKDELVALIKNFRSNESQ